LSLFAAEEEIISKLWDRLAGNEWCEAVDAAREAGAPIPKFDPAPDPEDADPDTPLPNTPVGRVDRFGPLAADRCEEHDPIQERRNRMTDAIADAYTSRDRVLIDALMTFWTYLGEASPSSSKQ
jgi:hypothetical protein